MIDLLLQFRQGSGKDLDSANSDEMILACKIAKTITITIKPQVIPSQYRYHVIIHSGSFGNDS